MLSGRELGGWHFQLWEEKENSFISFPHPHDPILTPVIKYDLISQSISSHSFVVCRFNNFTVHSLKLPLKTTQKLQVLPRWHAGHLSKVTNHMDFISLSPLVLPSNLLAYESMSQLRKPQGVKSLLFLRLPTLSDHTRIINITQDSQNFVRILKLSSLEELTTGPLSFLV